MATELNQTRNKHIFAAIESKGHEVVAMSAVFFALAVAYPSNFNNAICLAAILSTYAFVNVKNLEYEKLSLYGTSKEMLRSIPVNHSFVKYLTNDLDNESYFLGLKKDIAYRMEQNKNKYTRLITILVGALIYKFSLNYLLMMPALIGFRYLTRSRIYDPILKKIRECNDSRRFAGLYHNEIATHIQLADREIIEDKITELMNRPQVKLTPKNYVSAFFDLITENVYQFSDDWMRPVRQMLSG